jgi:hypothetical protein
LQEPDPEQGFGTWTQPKENKALTGEKKHEEIEKKRKRNKESIKLE